MASERAMGIFSKIDRFMNDGDECGQVTSTANAIPGGKCLAAIRQSKSRLQYQKAFQDLCFDLPHPANLLTEAEQNYIEHKAIDSGDPEGPPSTRLTLVHLF